ncbi:MAG: hypothetical protein D6690_16915 [Nitrospirae bacterium]|nr:MAG: hypothetical protein D6690_16915 [Nitrospirota bacterium]
MTRCLILMLAVSACAGPSYRQHVLDEIRLRAQERILHQARREFEQGAYQAVVQRLTRMLRLYPTTPLQEEALWWLARSFEEQGAWREALTQYQTLIEGAPTGRYRVSAERRLADIEQRLHHVDERQGSVRALRLAVAAIVENADRREESVGRIARNGFNTVLIDLGCSISDHTVDQAPTLTSFSFQVSQLDDRLPLWIRTARARGLRVYVGVPLRCLGALHNAPPKDWRDRRYRPAQRALEPSPWFDLFHPQYQAFMFHVLRGIVQLDPDGLVFLADPPLGLYEGFSPEAWQAFERAFEISFTPHTLFELNGALPSSQQQGARLEGATMAVVPEFWRWAGWKMRQRLRLLHTLRQQLKRVKPALDIGASVHLLSVQKPHVALGCLGEDALETARWHWDFMMVILVDHSHEDCRILDASGESVSVSEFFHGNAVEPFFIALGDTRDVWFSLSRRASASLLERVLSSVRVPRHSHGVSSPRIGIVYE